MERLLEYVVVSQKTRDTFSLQSFQGIQRTIAARYILLLLSMAEPENQLSPHLRGEMIDTASELLVIVDDADSSSEELLNTASLIVSLIGEVCSLADDVLVVHPG